MTHQPVNNTAQASLVYGYGSGPDIMSGFYVRDNVNPWDAPALSDLADAFQDWWDDQVKPLQVDDLTLREIRCADLENEFGARFTKTVGVTGTVVTTPAPAAVTALVHFTGASGSAPRKGTVFHPGLTEAQITDGAIDSGFASDLSDAYTALLTASGFTLSQAHVIVSRYQGTHLVTLTDGRVVKRPSKRDPALTNTIAAVTVPTRYGVQKRRRPSPL